MPRTHIVKSFEGNSNFQIKLFLQQQWEHCAMEILKVRLVTFILKVYLVAKSQFQLDG